jgi:hypothetical protein
MLNLGLTTGQQGKQYHLHFIENSVIEQEIYPR